MKIRKKRFAAAGILMAAAVTGMIGGISRSGSTSASAAARVSDSEASFIRTYNAQGEYQTKPAGTGNVYQIHGVRAVVTAAGGRQTVELYLKQAADDSRMYPVYRDMVQTMDSSVTDRQARQAYAELKSADYQNSINRPAVVAGKTSATYTVKEHKNGTVTCALTIFQMK